MTDGQQIIRNKQKLKNAFRSAWKSQNNNAIFQAMKFSYSIGLHDMSLFHFVNDITTLNVFSNKIIEININNGLGPSFCLGCGEGHSEFN